MRIAIASGKGGTGKTTVAVSLALSVATREKVSLLDCDVEEPNAALFLHEQIGSADKHGFNPNADTAQVFVKVPKVDNDKCTKCGRCSSVCEFNAIALTKTGPMIFPELCHSCGGCALFCPTQAITEADRAVGKIHRFVHENLTFIEGLLNVGEAMSTPVICKVKKMVATDGLVIVDCPPGTACPMVAAVRDVDFAILVTEPTPFGLHDLTLAVETVRELSVPFGVIVNRADDAELCVREYCQKEKIPLLLEIPDSRAVAEGYSRGVPILASMPELAGAYEKMLVQIGVLAQAACCGGNQ